MRLIKITLFFLAFTFCCLYLLNSLGCAQPIPHGYSDKYGPFTIQDQHIIEQIIADQLRAEKRLDEAELADDELDEFEREMAHER
jgi:hypothetical protein